MGGDDIHKTHEFSPKGLNVSYIHAVFVIKPTFWIGSTRCTQVITMMGTET